MRGAVSIGLVGAALAAVVAADVAALASSGSAAAPVALRAQATQLVAEPPVRVRAIDAVPPTPVDIVVAAPVATRPVHQVSRARVIAPTSGCGSPAARGAAALGSMVHPVPSGVTISWLGGRSDLLGLTFLAQRHVDVYVRSCGSESPELLRHVVAHELGHAYDASRMTPALRAQYLAARGIPAGTPWMGCDRCTDFATPAGDFAETYALWLRGGGESRSQLAAAPGAAQLAALGAQFFARP